MSIRAKVLSLVDVMMRVPPILVIDEILKIGMGLPTHFSMNEVHNATTSLGQAASSSYVEQAIENISEAAVHDGILSSSFSAQLGDLAQDTNLASILAATSVKFFICLLGFFSAACVFMLWTRHLVMVYMFVMSLGLTFLSYWSNVSALTLLEEKPCLLLELVSLNSTRIMETGGLVMAIMPHIVAQWFMGMLFAYVHLGPRFPTLQKQMPLIFASPIFVAMLPLPPQLMKNAPICADVIPLLLTQATLFMSAMDAGKTVYNGYHYAVNFVSNFGTSALIENEWQRLNVPSVLRVFWILRILQEALSIMVHESVTFGTILPLTERLLVDGCETLTAVLGMTAVISMVCHYIGRLFQFFLMNFDSDEEKSLGTVSAVLFYILALQTGLTSLAPEKRFVRLCRNLCLLATAILHFLHSIVSPILMSLSAARNPSRERHIRVLAVCAFLIIAPLTLLSHLWYRHTPSTWLFSVTVFSVEVVIKVLVSLATYTLFLVDARRDCFWEKLDDYLYYVRAFGNSVEFFFGILLFFNGCWILVFESGGAIRAIMMCIHAYFNIWCEARSGWSTFMKRRTAVHKISSLPEATPAQLGAFDDVCAICYQEMLSAKITRCRHFFHGVCLRKWLYVQDRCPLCHEIMMYTNNESGSDTGQHTPERQLTNTIEALTNTPLRRSSITATDVQAFNTRTTSNSRSNSVEDASNNARTTVATAAASSSQFRQLGDAPH